jgi:hypothetical protein
MREREKDRERERKGKRPLKVETFLSAPDMLARHLLVRRDSAVPNAPPGQGRPGPQTTLVLNPGPTPVMFADLNKQKCACKIGSLFHMCLHLSTEVTIHMCLYLSTEVTIHMCLYLSTEVTIHMCLHLSTEVTIHMCLHLSTEVTIHMCLYLSTEVTIHICLHLSTEVTIPYNTLTPDFTVFLCPQSTSRDPTTRHFLIPL